MSFNIQYGDIGSALGLAAAAGRGDRARVVGQQDEEFLRTMQQAQAHADSNYANQIQQAIGVQQGNAQMQMQQQAAAQHQQQVAQAQQQDQQNSNRSYALQSAGLLASVGDRQQNRGIQQQNADTREQNADQRASVPHKDAPAMQAYVAGLNLPPEKAAQAQAYIAATGNLPPDIVPHAATGGLTADYRKDDLEYRRQERQLKSAEHALKLVAYDESKMDHFMAGPSTTVPGAVKGQEAQFLAAKAQVDQLHQSLSTLEQRLNAPTVTPTQPVQNGPAGTPPVSSAPAPQPRNYAAVATNAAGVKVGYDQQSGQWVPIP